MKENFGKLSAPRTHVGKSRVTAKIGIELCASATTRSTMTSLPDVALQQGAQTQEEASHSLMN
jgi:hypothetical protein